MEPCWNGHGYCGRAKHFSGHWENSAGGWVLIAAVWDKPPATNQPTSYQPATNQLPTSYQPATNQLFHVKNAGKFQDFQIAI